MIKKNILIGVCSGIAIYKIPDLIRKLKKKNYNVKVLMTPNAAEMISPVIFQTLTGNQVYIDTFHYDYNPNIKHIALSKWADIFLIAPATANTINKISAGIADNLLLNIVLSIAKKILIAPAMNTVMYENFATQKSISNLKNNGFHFIGPVKGELACGDIGQGKMIDIEDIHSKIEILLKTDISLKNKKILITSGANREKIDDIRFITNYSTGKQGYNLAKAASLLGAEVLLITGWTTESIDTSLFKIIKAESASEMYKTVKTNISNYDIFISAAAVSDFKPVKYISGKIKKETLKNLNIELEKTKDILYEIKDIPNVIKVGFSAETDNIIENSRKKLVNKNLDYIVANDVSKEDIGFISDYNEVTIINKNNKIFKTEKMSKFDISIFILETICS